MSPGISAELNPGLLESMPIPDLACSTAPHPLCRAVVVIPAKDEEKSLPATLDALRMQRELNGRPLAGGCYEVLLLLNNCTDGSGVVARSYAAAYPDFNLHVIECALPPGQAHVGTARRALMDAACSRLESLGETTVQGARCSAILSTDADTRVAPVWIAASLKEMEAGADVVGGVIHLFAGDLAALDRGTRQAYERDRRLQGLVARFESLLDPDPADPWPRHLEHFGASLACTPAIYRRCGGLPAVKTLEDLAFIDALRKVGASIRHSPLVQVWTSARLDGRAEVGLSGQLRHWRDENAAGEPQMVDSAEWMEHRFSQMSRLRRLNQAGDASALRAFPLAWRRRIAECLGRDLPDAAFLERIDCDRLIEEMFEATGGGPRRDEITSVLRRLELRIRQLECAQADRAESVRFAGIGQASTPDGSARNHEPDLR